MSDSSTALHFANQQRQLTFLRALQDNAVNGVPSCASKMLLTDNLRTKWGFDGYVTSDCGAVGNVFTAHNFTKSADATCSATLSAGMVSGAPSEHSCPFLCSLVRCPKKNTRTTTAGVSSAATGRKETSTLRSPLTV